MYLDNQANYADDNETELKQLRVSQHGTPSFHEGGRSPLRDEGVHRLPNTGSAIYSITYYPTERNK